MLAVFCVHMKMHPAEAVIEVMRCYYGNYRRHKQPYMKRMPDLFCQQQQYTHAKQCQRQKPVMVFPETMAECIHPYH